jgi:hypothetical protein
VLDIVDRGKRKTLEVPGDAVAHLVRRQAAIGPDDADDRNVDIGEDIRWRAQHRERPDDAEQQREDDKSVGPSECYPDDPHCGTPIACICTNLRTPLPTDALPVDPRRFNHATKPQI